MFAGESMLGVSAESKEMTEMSCVKAMHGIVKSAGAPSGTKLLVRRLTIDSTP